MQKVATVMVGLLGVAACATPAELNEEQAATQGACIQGHGYWKNHAWPVSSLALGATSYSEAQLQTILAAPVGGNGLVDLAHQLIAAKLDVAVGNSSAALAATIAQADALVGALVVPPVGTGHLSPATTDALATQLDNFVSGTTASGPCVPASSRADLAVTQTASNASPNVGDTVAFTITLANDGPATATNVAVSDALPAGLAFVSATASQGTYDAAHGTWTVGAVSAPQTLVVAAIVTSPSPLTNTAAVGHSDQFDGVPGNNSASVTITPEQADLAITQTASAATANVGDTVAFTITVANNGPAVATNVAVSDALPPGLTFVSATSSQGAYDAGSGTWNVGTVTGPQTLVLAATVVSPSALTNMAAISHADQFDPVLGNNSATITLSPAGADLAVAQTASNATPNVGDLITLTITLANNGPDIATDVTVTDLLPAGLSLVAATATQGSYLTSTGTWNVGTASPMQTLLIAAIVVSPDPQTNTAEISHSDQFDPITGNNTATVTLSPAGADLAVAQTASNATPNVGDAVTLTITLANNGPGTATNVTVSDLLPAGLTFVSATPSQGSYLTNTGTWDVGTVSAPQTLAIVATVVSPAAQTNTAAITHADQFDPVTGNNTATVTLTPAGADLAVAQTASNATPNVGDAVTLTITLANNGPGTATNVTVSDLLPAGLTFVSATPSQGSYLTNTGTWSVGTVSAPQTLAIVATVVSPAAQTNTAAITHADQFDPVTGNNTATVTLTPAGADLAVAQTASNATPNVGDAVTLTITLANNGPGTATNVTVSDLLPAGLTFVSATPSQGSYLTNTGTWSVGTVSAPQTLAIVATVVSPASLTNTAAISHADQFDPVTANNAASITIN